MLKFFEEKKGEDPKDFEDETFLGQVPLFSGEGWTPACGSDGPQVPFFNRDGWTPACGFEGPQASVLGGDGWTSTCGSEGTHVSHEYCGRGTPLVKLRFRRWVPPCGPKILQVGTPLWTCGTAGTPRWRDTWATKCATRNNRGAAE